MMKRSMVLGAAGAAAMAWAGATEARGQQPSVFPARGGGLVSTMPTLAGVFDETQVVTVSFEGGSVREYVEAIKKVAPATNIVVMACADKVEMPAVQLTKVSLSTALQLLDGRSTQGAQGYTELHVQYNEGDEEGQGIWAIDCETSLRDPYGGRGYRIWSVKDMVGEDQKTTINDVMSVVDSALSMVDEGEAEAGTPPQVKFHEATGLIIAKGTDAQLGVIDEVLNAMRETAEGSIAGEPGMLWYTSGLKSGAFGGAPAPSAAGALAEAARDAAALAEVRAAQDAQVAELQETVRLLRDQIEELRRELEQARQGTTEGGGGAAATPARSGGGGGGAVQAIW